MIELVLLVFVLGGSVLAAMGPVVREHLLEFVAHSWLVGSVVSAGVALIGLRLGLDVPEMVWVVRAAAGVAVVIAARAELARRRASVAREAMVTSGSSTWRFSPGIVACLIGLVIGIDVALRASELAITLGDEANVWSSRAKIVWYLHGLNEAAFECIRTHPQVASPGYPWLNPLLQILAYGFEGKALDAFSRFPIQMFGIVLPLLIFGALSRHRHSWISAILILGVCSSRQYRECVAVGAGDAMIAAYTIGLVTALRRVSVESTAGVADSAAYAWLAGLHGAGLVFTKNEGTLWFLCIVAPYVVVWIVRRVVIWRRLAAITVPPCVIFVENAWRNLVFDTHIDRQRSAELLVGTDGVVELDLAGRVAAVFRNFAHEGWFDFSETHGIVAIALVCGLAAIVPRYRAVLPLVVALGLFGSGVAVVYLTTVEDIEGHMRWSVERILFQMMPIAVLVIGSLLEGRGFVADPPKGPLARQS